MNDLIPHPTDRAELPVAGAEVCYQRWGSPAAPTVLLLAGLGSAMESWPDGFCEALLRQNLQVVRYDYRDTGQSTTYEPGSPGYAFDDLVADALALIDGLEIERAHLMGISMGGGIAQRIAIEQPHRVASLTLISTSPGLRPGVRPPADLPPPAPEVLEYFSRQQPRSGRDGQQTVIEMMVESQRFLAGRECFDEALAREQAEQVVRRSRDPAAARNHSAIAPGAAFRDRLGAVSAPTAVAHGSADRLFPDAHGRALAREIPGASFLSLAGMGHQPPPARYWPTLAAQPGRLCPAARSATAADASGS